MKVNRAGPDPASKLREASPAARGQRLARLYSSSEGVRTRPTKTLYSLPSCRRARRAGRRAAFAWRSRRCRSSCSGRSDVVRSGRRFASSIGRRRPPLSSDLRDSRAANVTTAAYPFGGAWRLSACAMPAFQRCLSRAVLLPESLWGCCSFGAGLYVLTRSLPPGIVGIPAS